jgi:hypothetical protein
LGTPSPDAIGEPTALAASSNSSSDAEVRGAIEAGLKDHLNRPVKPT